MHEKLKTLLVYPKIVNQNAKDKMSLHEKILSDNKNYEILASIGGSLSLKKNTNFSTVSNFADEASFRPDIVVFLSDDNKIYESLKKIYPKKGAFFPLISSSKVERTKEIKNYCKLNNLKTQVDFYKRADELFLSLKKEQMIKKIGVPTIGRAIYAGDILHNGLEMVDVLRFFLGEVIDYSLIGSKNDGISFMLKFSKNICVPVQSLCAGNIKEFSLEIWGDNGCMDVCDAGRYIRFRPKIKHPADKGFFGICRKEYKDFFYKPKEATQKLYDNLSDAVNNETSTLSPIENLIKSQNVMNNIKTLEEEIGFMMNY